MRPPNTKRTILIAVDGSDHAKYAYKWSLDNIVRPDDFVLLVQCQNGKAGNGQAYLEIDLNAPAADDVEKAERSRFQTLASTYLSELSQRLITGKPIVLKGDPKQALVAKASDVHADVIIMGSRGLGSLKKAIVGSVSDYCVHNATCPVLIVRKPTA